MNYSNAEQLASAVIIVNITAITSITPGVLHSLEECLIRLAHFQTKCLTFIKKMIPTFLSSVQGFSGNPRKYLHHMYLNFKAKSWFQISARPGASYVPLEK